MALAPLTVNKSPKRLTVLHVNHLLLLTTLL